MCKSKTVSWPLAQGWFEQEVNLVEGKSDGRGNDGVGREPEFQAVTVIENNLFRSLVNVSTFNVQPLLLLGTCGLCC